MVINVTGDTHGEDDYGKLSPVLWPEGQLLSRNDYLVIMGDFGAMRGCGDGSLKLSERDQKLLSWFEKQPWTTLFVDGNRDNHDILDGLAVSEMYGGKVHVAPGYPHVIHLMRGEVYNIPKNEQETVRCLAFGGAKSPDRDWHVAGENWWPREMPDDTDFKNCIDKLEAAHWAVDYVFTHEVPLNAKFDAAGKNYARALGDQLSSFLQYVDDSLDKQRLVCWFSGHYHVDKYVMDNQHRILFQDIVRL